MLMLFVLSLSVLNYCKQILRITFNVKSVFCDIVELNRWIDGFLEFCNEYNCMCVSKNSCFKLFLKSVPLSVTISFGTPWCVVKINRAIFWKWIYYCQTFLACCLERINAINFHWFEGVGVIIYLGFAGFLSFLFIWHISQKIM